MKAKYDWSEKHVREAVENTNTYTACLKYLGLSIKQGYSQLKRMIAKYNIDTSHFIWKVDNSFDGETRVCSKCKQRKPLSEFYNRRRNYRGKFTICKQCCNSTYGRGRAKKDKLYWLHLYGGRCQCCGLEVNENNYVVFDFHHTDPSIKEKGPNTIYRYSRETAKKELDKCIILCSNCHRLEHHKIKIKKDE